MRLVILTGASGSGKTAITQAIVSKRPPVAKVLRFDSIGVPPAEEMVAVSGSLEAWQRDMTLEWIARISAMRELDRPVLFEGQMRLAFLREGLSSAGLTGARIILVDCNDATRVHRLTADRRQPELAAPTMMSWAAYLRREAQEANCEVLDTTGVSLRSSVEQVLLYLQS
jgi:dephospho-CoA kinase